MASEQRGASMNYPVERQNRDFIIYTHNIYREKERERTLRGACNLCSSPSSHPKFRALLRPLYNYMCAVSATINALVTEKVRRVELK